MVEQNHPELNMLIADLCKKEQLEDDHRRIPTTDSAYSSREGRSIQIEETTTFIGSDMASGQEPSGSTNQIWNPT